MGPVGGDDSEKPWQLPLISPFIEVQNFLKSGVKKGRARNFRILARGSRAGLKVKLLQQKGEQEHMQCLRDLEY